MSASIHQRYGKIKRHRKDTAVSVPKRAEVYRHRWFSSTAK